MAAIMTPDDCHNPNTLETTLKWAKKRITDMRVEERRKVIKL